MEATIDETLHATAMQPEVDDMWAGSRTRVESPDIQLETAGKSIFWDWYEQHKDDVILRIKVLVVKIVIRLKDFKSVFVVIFGPDS